MQPTDKNTREPDGSSRDRKPSRLPEESANDFQRAHWTSTYWAYRVGDQSYNRGRTR